MRGRGRRREHHLSVMCRACPTLRPCRCRQDMAQKPQARPPYDAIIAYLKDRSGTRFDPRTVAKWSCKVAASVEGASGCPRVQAGHRRQVRDVAERRTRCLPTCRPETLFSTKFEGYIEEGKRWAEKTGYHSSTRRPKNDPQ